MRLVKTRQHPSGVRAATTKHVAPSPGLALMRSFLFDTNWRQWLASSGLFQHQHFFISTSHVTIICQVEWKAHSGVCQTERLYRLSQQRVRQNYILRLSSDWLHYVTKGNSFDSFSAFFLMLPYSSCGGCGGQRWESCGLHWRLGQAEMRLPAFRQRRGRLKSPRAPDILTLEDDPPAAVTLWQPLPPTEPPYLIQMWL